MSVKRPRAAFEADLQAKQSPFVLFGTPLPPLDPDVRDDGSYVPVWKQEVRDERGRKRLHGAFTGGFSAGYFNTVGSKEGWTPSAFVSSRTNRRKDDLTAAQQRPEDFMDDEDLADAEESRKLQTAQDFASFGSTEDEVGRSGGLAGLFRIEGETMGAKLLKRMGWKEGQGIGPKVLRKARLGVGSGAGAADEQQAAHLFAPENVVMIKFERKTDYKGLGFAGEARLAPLKPASEDRHSEDEDENDFLGPSKPLSLLSKRTKKPEKSRGGIGIGVLNDTGSDDEDPYEIGPRISYNKVIGGDKKKKKKKDAVPTTAANPLLKSKPVFVSKKMRMGVKKCHDGRLPLDGFILAQQPDPLVSEMYTSGKYPPPQVPPDWKSSRQPLPARAESAAAHMSTADAAKASKLDPKSRAALLGEKQLPGKSVFDFLSASARDRLVNATGNKNLPQAKGEIPAAYAMSAQEKLAELLKEIPSLDKATATAAIARGASGGAPYADNEAKRSRYRSYLEYQAGFLPTLPPKPAGMSNDDWLREFHEFFNCARIFRPMSGFMASRFTTSSSSALASSSDRPGDAVAERALISRPPPKPSDPAEEAARMGMFGPMTRSSHDFYPARLLCKRFNVKPPAVVQADADVERNTAPQRPSRADAYDYSTPSRGPASPSGHGDDGGHDGRIVPEEARAPDAKVSPESSGTTAVVDPTRNAALEKARAGDEVFKAVFGDSSDEEE